MSKTPPPYPPVANLALRDQPSALSTAAPLPPEVLEDLREHTTTARAENTLAAYKADWSAWLAWCEKMKQNPLPADPVAVAAYASEMSKGGKKYATIRRHLSTISRFHTMRNLPSPAKTEQVRVVLDSIARTKGTKQKQMDPITLDELAQILSPMKATPYDLRNRALLLTGFHGAFRSSELAALRCDDVDWRDEGVVITVRRSKTDQTGQGFEKPLRYTGDTFCAPTALKTWILAAGITEGPLFRVFDRYGKMGEEGITRTVVNRMIERYCGLAKINAARFASHSLRAGFVTQALEESNDPMLIAGMTGHKSLEMIRRYDRRKKRNPFTGVATLRSREEKK
ncbi:MAG TPA: site-specific integrase [Archangium sp.]